MRAERPRMIVTVTATSREFDPEDGTGRVRLKREYHLTLNWEAHALGEESEAIDVALRAAETTGMLHDSVYRVDVSVEWDGVDAADD